jgi:hypothetical protein
MALHRLVHIHRVHTGSVKAGEPHIPHNHEFEGILWVLRPLGNKLATCLGPLAI